MSIFWTKLKSRVWSKNLFFVGLRVAIEYYIDQVVLDSTSVIKYSIRVAFSIRIGGAKSIEPISIKPTIQIE